MAGVWTRNYTNKLCCLLAGASYDPPTRANFYADGTMGQKDHTGGTGNPNYNSNFLASFPTMPGVSYGSGSTTNWNIAFGTGTTAPDYDDYCMENFVEGFTVSQSNIFVSQYDYDETSHTYSSTKRYVLQYTGSSELTITEFGLFVAYAMIYHEVFDTPITLNQYESVVIELTQSFPLVNYQPYPT